MCESPVTQYIRSEFLSLDQLVERAGVLRQRIIALIEGRCLPRHSYEITVRRSVSSFIGERDVPQETERFYAPSNVELLKDLEATVLSNDLKLLAETVWQDFGEQYRQELVGCGGVADGSIAADEINTIIAENFQHWLDGTFGLCTRNATVREIVLKGVSIRRIRSLTEDGTREEISAEDLPALQEALTTLDTVASNFAPDERVTSSRNKWLNLIAERYGLQTLLKGNVSKEAQEIWQPCDRESEGNLRKHRSEACP